MTPALATAATELPFVDLQTGQAHYGEDVARRMQRVIARGAYIMGPEVEELEAKLASFVGVRHAITVGSGTQALELALRALGIGPGDEVITVPFTWISSAEAIALVGATPVFVDIERGSFNMDPSGVDAAVTPRTRALLPVSLFGQMARFSELNAIAEKHGLAVLEDGAQSFGASQQGKRSCSATLVGATSFFPTKPLGCYGDGGALFTNDDRLSQALRALRSHGSLRRHHHTVVGTNGRLDTIQAAVLLGKLPYLERELSARQRIGQRYSEALADTPGVTTPALSADSTHVYAQYTLRCRDRESLARGLGDRGIPTAIYYPECLHRQPVFANLSHRDLPEAEAAAREVLSLPMHPYLTAADQARIVDAVKAALG